MIPQPNMKALAKDSVERGMSRVSRIIRRAIYGDFPWHDLSFDPRYNDWFLAHRATAKELEKQRAESGAFDTRFSIIVPLFRTPLNLFSEMIDSVRAQSYGKWELILVNASPEDEGLAFAASDAVASDSRIRVVSLEGNGGITANTNAGVAEATGDYVCFFDHDDLLEPDALYEYASAIQKQPDVGLLYCDEDKIDENGRYIEAHIKPGFSIDLVRTNNYVCHLLCVKKELLDRIGPNDPRYDGAQDHALTLRVSELTDTIVRVPRVLYHWRITENSTASREAVDKNAKSYANEAGRRAIQDHLDRLEIKAMVKPHSLGWAFIHEVDYEIAGNPLISIVVSGNSQDEIELCAHSICSFSAHDNIEIIPILHRGNHAVNRARDLNAAVGKAHGKYVLFIDAGARAVSNYAQDPIIALLRICQRKDVGVACGRLIDCDNRVNQAGMIVPGKNQLPISANVGIDGFATGYGAYNALTRNYSLASASFMMMHRGTFEGVGGFDEGYSHGYFDADFCLKLRSAGYLVTFEPRALLRLTKTGTNRLAAEAEPSEELLDDAARLLSRWPDFFAEGDPYFNPNFVAPYFTMFK